MKFFEMVFTQSCGNCLRVFFRHNNVFTREKFIKFIRSELLAEIEVAYFLCTSNKDQGLLTIYTEIYLDKCFYLDLLAKDFIECGFAERDLTSIKVIVRAFKDNI